jgi:protein-tyrosine-phosphatase
MVKPLKIVLFACVENACRSQMAEAFFNQLAKEKAQAISVGTKPSKDVNPNAVAVMREVRVDISNKKSGGWLKGLLKS